MATVKYKNLGGKDVEVNDTPENRAAAEKLGWKLKKKAAKKEPKQEEE